MAKFSHSMAHISANIWSIFVKFSLWFLFFFNFFLDMVTVCKKSQKKRFVTSSHIGRYVCAMYLIQDLEWKATIPLPLCQAEKQNSIKITKYWLSCRVVQKNIWLKVKKMQITESCFNYFTLSYHNFTHFLHTNKIDWAKWWIQLRNQGFHVTFQDNADNLIKSKKKSVACSIKTRALLLS